MDDEQVGAYWDCNADAWTRLSRAGYDVYRDKLNTPAFLRMLPDVHGKTGIDIGCGEGSNTRAVAELGAIMVGVDISRTFLSHARDAESDDPLGIDYRLASAQALPFDDGAFHFATSFMCLMDVPDYEVALAEAFRVLAPGGFLQFSITHPCFDTPHRRNLRNAEGATYAIEVGRYFDRLDGEIQEWIFGAAPEQERRGLPLFRVPRFHRPLSDWLNTVNRTGFVIEQLAEPSLEGPATGELAYLQDSQVVAYFLHVRCRKPA